ncbi:MAG: glycosyltransferase [Fibrobacter sp.]|nr:glycosyltransferase [Fibrobacter sp.]
MQKRILFFITSLAGGGAEKVLVNMVNHLDKTKFKVTVLTLFDVGINKKNLSNDIEYKYVFKHLFRGNTLLFKLFSPSFLFKHMIKGKYDIIVSYFQGPTTRIIAGCTDPNAKLVQWIHNEFHNRNDIVHCYRNDSECIQLQKKFNATVYVANTVKEAYLKTFPELAGNDHVLYNIVEFEKIRQLSQEQINNENIFNHKFNLISVGRFVPQKAFDRLLNIVAKLKNNKIDIGFTLLGSGPLEKNLREQTKELGIENNVNFLGYLTNPYKYVKNADLFVCSSLHEGFSTAVTESLIVGTPVITTKCSGMQELLGYNEFGVIVENSESALYDGIKELLTNNFSLQHYKQKAEQRSKYFNTQETLKKIQTLLLSL